MAAKNIAFKSLNEGSSWADDDDEVDALPFTFEPQLADVVEKEQPEEEAPARREHDSAKHDDTSGRGLRQERNYDDRRGGHNSDRRGGGGGYHDDRHHERDNYRSSSQRDDRHRDGGGDHVERSERPKNPLPDRPPYKLFVGNLPFQMNEDDVADFLGDVATITHIHFPLDMASNRPKGFAYVEFTTRDALVKALELDGQSIRGRSVKIDVASERRQDRSGGGGGGSFFDKRESRPHRSHDRDERAAPAPKERPQFALLPRSAASTDSSDGAKKASIFGDAKPRDESVYLERQKAKDLERKQAKDAARKKSKEQQQERKQHETEQLARKKSVDDVLPAAESDKKQAPASSARKNSHDDSHGFRAAGRGSTRGGRGDRPARGEGRGRGGEHGSHADRPARTESRGRSEHTGRGGRGGEHTGRGGHGGRGGRDATAAAAKKELAETAAPATAAPASTRKSEPRAKRTEPVKVKIAAPAPVKNVNAFSLLGDDSDSD